MNHQTQIDDGFLPPPTSFYTFEQKALSSVALLLLGYYLLSIFALHPSTITTIVYRITTYLLPTRLISLLERLMGPYERPGAKRHGHRRSDSGEKRMSPVHRIQNAIRKSSSFPPYKLPSSKSKIIYVGLGNRDNSCYQNSVLQGLASLPAFRNHVERNLIACRRTNTSTLTHEALLTLLDQLNVMGTASTHTWIPTDLKIMSSYTQQDAQEYFSEIMNAVESEAAGSERIQQKRAGSPVSIHNKESERIQQNKAGSRMSIDNILNREDPALEGQEQETLPTSFQDSRIQGTISFSPMEGLQAQKLTCTHCRYSEGFNLTLFTCLTLNMGHRGDSMLEELLDDYARSELVGPVECVKCTKAAAVTEIAAAHQLLEKATDCAAKHDAVPRTAEKPTSVLRMKAKQDTVGRLPANLVIHINRSIFDDYGRPHKNDRHVQVPLLLPFHEKWCAIREECQDFKAETTYELKCMVTHSGNHENGHYTALAQRGKDGWFEFDDNDVRPWSTEAVLEQGNGFMLFYEKIDESQETLPAQAAVQTALQAAYPRVEPTYPSPSSSESENFFEMEQHTPPRAVPAMATASGGLPAGMESKPLLTPPETPPISGLVDPPKHFLYTSEMMRSKAGKENNPLSTLPVTPFMLEPADPPKQFVHLSEVMKRPERAQ